ncbi:MAG TPA: hypothetical protein VI756_24825 [Blastocatellia bacterium]
MKMGLAGAGAVLFLLAVRPACAHRLDEYLQATTIAVEKDRIQAQIRLVPGVAVFPIVLASIDTDGDNAITESEERAYAERVLGDLSLSIDGNRVPLRLMSVKFATIEEMKKGCGEIQIDFDAQAPGGGLNRKLVLENHHQAKIGAYLVNCLVPQDRAIRIIAQNRNYQQSYYELDYVQSDLFAGSWSSAWWSTSLVWPGAAAVLLVAGFAITWRLARTPVPPNANDPANPEKWNTDRNRSNG